MPRGAPDYFVPASNISAVQIDNSSLLVGLGGVMPMDGKGRIYFYDTFKEGLARWGLLAGGNGKIPKLVNSAAFSPPVSIQFTPDQGAGAGVSELRTAFQFTQNNTVGVELALDVQGWDLYQYIMMDFRNGVKNYRARVRIQQTNKTVEIETTGGWVLIYGFPEAAGLQSWIQIKLVFDMGTAKYVRFVIGDTSIDLTQDCYFIGGSFLSYEILLDILMSSTNLNEEHPLLGYVIMTTDEP